MEINHSYKRGIGPIGLMLFSVSAMIGSGWLFSAMLVSKVAGPAAILAWVFTALLVIIIALSYAEISAMLPIAGGSSRFPQLTHGTFVSLFFGWITWFNAMTAPPIEVQAMIQYASNLWPSLLHPTADNLNALSLHGYAVAALLMVAFCIINIYSIRFITRLNSVFSIWKIIVAVLTALVLIITFFHPHNFHNPAHGGFAPFGWQGILTAIATGGIVFSFNGFKQSVELAGEAKNAARTIMIGIVGSIVLVLGIYILLQISFIGAMRPENLSHGWNLLNFSGDAGPLAGLLSSIGDNGFATLLYITALIATSSAGLVYTTSSARMLCSMSGNRQLPKFLQYVNTRGIPAKAVFINFILGMTFFLPFHGWYAMAKFLSSIIALSYITGPICVLCLRYQLPEYRRPFRLPLVKLLAFIGFYVCTMIVYWTGWSTVSKLGIILFIAFLVSMAYRIFSARPRGLTMNWRSAAWMWPYLVGLYIISYLGAYGGRNIIPFGWDFVFLGILSLFSLYFAVKLRANDEHVRISMQRFEEEIKTGVPSTIPDEESDGSGTAVVGSPKEALS